MADQYEESLKSLTEMHSVIGVCLHTDSHIISNFFPRAINNQRVNSFVQVIQEMSLGYSSVGRKVSQFCFGYNGGAVLVLTADNIFLSFLLEDISSVPFLVNTGSVFIKDHSNKISSPQPPITEESESGNSGPKIDAEVWSNYKTSLHEMISKVVGTASSQKLMKRVVASVGGDLESGLPKERFRELGVSLILEIPNRSKQAALRPELDELLKKYQ